MWSFHHFRWFLRWWFVDPDENKNQTCSGDWYLWVCATWCRSKSKSRSSEIKCGFIRGLGRSTCSHESHTSCRLFTCELIKNVSCNSLTPCYIEQLGFVEGLLMVCVFQLFWDHRKPIIKLLKLYYWSILVFNLWFTLSALIRLQLSAQTLFNHLHTISSAPNSRNTKLATSWWTSGEPVVEFLHHRARGREKIGLESSCVQRHPCRQKL